MLLTRIWRWPDFGATRGVTVNMSAFLACYQCYCVGLSLVWGLNLRAVVCGIFWSSLPGVFSGYSGFLPSFIGLMVQPIKQSSNKCDLIIIIIIAFKGAIRDLLQSPHSATNRLQHVRSNGPGAIVCKSRATHRTLIACKCHVTCHLVRRDSSAIKFDRVEIAFIWALFYWLNHETDEGGEETRVTGENPWRRASENATY